MFIPSEKVRKQMLTEPDFIWFVPSEGNETYAILIKSNSNVLKSITKNVKVQLICGINEISNTERYFCLTLRIFDDELHPLLILKVQREKEEHLAFQEIINQKSTPIFLYDELCQCVAYGNGCFDKNKLEKLRALIGSIDSLYTGEFDEKASISLDNMESTVDPTRKFENSITIPIITIDLKLSVFQTWDTYNYSLTESHSFRLDSSDEGAGLEQRVWTAFESLYPFGIFRSPEVLDGTKKRELTDILAFSDKNLILVESKATAVFLPKSEQGTSRKVHNLGKQINKALNQLQGAVKRIRKSKIFGVGGREIIFNDLQKLIPHAVVIVSEILPYSEWEQCVEKALYLSKVNHALFQIIDVRELMNIVIASSNIKYDSETRANAFDYYLSERFGEFVKSKNIHIRLKFLP